MTPRQTRSLEMYSPTRSSGPMPFMDATTRMFSGHRRSAKAGITFGQSPGLGADEDDRQVLDFGQFGEAREATLRLLFELCEPANLETVAVHLLRTGLRQFDPVHLHAAAYEVRSENRAHRTETDDADLVSFQGSPLWTAQSTGAYNGIMTGGILSPVPATPAP